MSEQYDKILNRGPRISCSSVVQTAVVVLLGLHAVMLGWMGWRYSPTIDEPAHLVAGLSHWKFARFDLYRVNPPLVRLVASLPILLVNPKTDWSGFTEAPYSRPEFTIAPAFVNANGSSTFWHFTLARWACIPFSLIGGYSCYRWARDLYGVAAGAVALALWCFCPNILGNGALITADVPAAALGVMASYFFWRWLSVGRLLRRARPFRSDLVSVCDSTHDSGWLRTLLAGLTLGLAELTKSTWLILFALWPLIWMIWEFRRYSAELENPKSQIPNPKFTQLAIVLLIAIYILNLGYGFENSFQRLDKFQFISHALGGAEAHAIPGNRFTETWLGTVPVPVPANYLYGIDAQRHDFEVGKWSYLRGEHKVGGWWYYYLYAMFVKMSVGTLVLIVLAAAFSVARITKILRKTSDKELGGASRPDEHDHRQSLLNSIVVLAPAFALIVVVSSQTGFNRYLRYVLPAFPFLFVWTSQIARLWSVQGYPGLTPSAWPYLGIRSSNFQPALSILVMLPLLASVASSLAVFPHSLSYFNDFAGGPLKGAAHLLDANIDWGQDLLYLKDWYDAHPEARPLQIVYFGRVDPKSADANFDSASHFTAAQLREEQPRRSGLDEEVPRGELAAGWYAISLNNLHGYKHDGGEDRGSAWLKNCGPSASVGYSIRIYFTQPK